MSDAEAVDEMILRILLDSHLGRRWLVQASERVRLQERISALRKSGLSDRIIEQLWACGPSDVLDRLGELTPAQIAALNAAV